MRLKNLSLGLLWMTAVAFALPGCAGSGGGGSDDGASGGSINATLTQAQDTNANLTPITDIGAQGDTDGSVRNQTLNGNLEQAPGPDGISVRRVEAFVDYSNHPLAANEPYTLVRPGLPGEATLTLTEEGGPLGGTRTWVAVSGSLVLESIRGNDITVRLENARMEPGGGTAQGTFVFAGRITFAVN